jgi:hypothetical protein
MLASHSASVSCETMFPAFRSFRSAVAVFSAGTSTSFGPSSSYPTARILIAWRPGPTLVAGKPKRPRWSLTTVTVTVEPSCLALTSTPSIGPSSIELTCPVSASLAGPSAPVV